MPDTPHTEWRSAAPPTGTPTRGPIRPGLPRPTGAPVDGPDRPGAAAEQLESRIAAAADFSAIRYSQSWEDPTCLVRALEIEPTDTVLSIAAAGDNSFALLLEDPAKVVCVDMSPAQVALMQLKQEAIRQLSHPDLLVLLGVEPGDALAVYRHIRSALPATARAYWDANQETIEQGVIHAGKLEKYFQLFQKWILPVTHRRSVIEAVFEERDPEARQEFWDRRFNTRRWQVLQRIFFSKTLLGRLGRDPAFFEHVEIDDVGRYYGERARHALVDIPAAGNWFLEYMLLGHYRDTSRSHPYLAAENLDILRERIDRLEIHTDQLERFVARHPAGTFDKYNLSDIFEWMDEDATERLLRTLAAASRKGGRICYWNNLVPRSRPESMADILEPHRELARDIHFHDRSFLYRDFQVEEILRVPDTPTGSPPP